MLKRCRQLAATGVAAALALGVIAGCSVSEDGANTGSTTNSTEETTAMKTLAEWVEEYPLEGESYMQSAMSGTYEAFYAVSTSDRFGGEDVATACAACHAREAFNAAYEEEGESILATNASDTVSSEYWSNCTNCHVGDPGDGVVEGGNAYGEAASASASELFSDEDWLCGQCHNMFPGAAYLEDDNSGIDQYKYGYDPDSMLKAMQEYYEENPISDSDIVAGMNGVPQLDETIDTVLYLTDACTALELFQDSTHQSMGLTCTDCHMTQTTSDDGTTYTNHNTTLSPLENPDALEFCLTCHEAQGIEDADAMVEFVEGKIDELAQIDLVAEADLQTLYDLLADAVANGGVDEDTLEAAKESYNLANVYYNFAQGRYAKIDDGGQMAAMNFDYCKELLEEADAIALEAAATLQ